MTRHRFKTAATHSRSKFDRHAVKNGKKAISIISCKIPRQNQHLGISEILQHTVADIGFAVFAPGNTSIFSTVPIIQLGCKVTCHFINIAASGKDKIFIFSVRVKVACVRKCSTDIGRRFLR